MNTKLTIKKRKDGTFEGTDGPVPYFWYKAVRDDGVTIEFGSTDGSHLEGESKELMIEKTERAGGKFGYKEIR